MKTPSIFILIMIVLVMVDQAQTNLPSKAEKMLFRGSIYHSFFEMTLVREARNLSGSYFFVKSGRTKLTKISGKIDADGKFILKELNDAHKPVGKFQGVLSENSESYDLDLKGIWTNSRKKPLEFDATGQIVDFTRDWQIQTISIQEKSKALRREINAEYPEIIGENTADVRRFNLAAKGIVLKTVTEFKKESSRLEADERKSPLFSGNNLDITYQVKFANDDFLSIEYGFTDSSHGMVHPMFYFEYLNYDLKTNRELQLSDLFAPDAKYLERLSAYCLKELQRRPPVNGEKLAVGEYVSSLDPKDENFEQWSLTPKGLLITFEEYQIAAYPAGVNFVMVPYSKLRDIARPGSILAKIAG